MRFYRRNQMYGTLTNSPGTGGTTFTSAEFAALPTIVAANNAVFPLIINPYGRGGLGTEIIWVTVHSAASTSVTVVRAKESTTAVNLVSGVDWISGLTRGQLDQIVQGDGVDGNGATIANSSVRATLSTSALWAPNVIEANPNVSDAYRATWAGDYTNNSGVNRAIDFWIVVGGVDTNINLAANVTSATARGWRIDAILVVIDNDSSGQAYLSYRARMGVAGGAGNDLHSITFPTVLLTGINFTTAQTILLDAKHPTNLTTLSVTARWGVYERLAASLDLAGLIGL